MTHTPTKKQAELLQALQDATLRGTPPTLATLGERLGVAKSTIHERLSVLAREGLVTAGVKHCTRNYRLTKRGKRHTTTP